MLNEQALLEVLEKVRHRYYGKYRGSVTDVDEATMRIKAAVPAVLGDLSTGWAMPCVPYAGPNVGIAFLPEVGSGVWIEFEGGDPSLPVWTGGYWRDGEYPSDVKAKVKVIVTASENKIVLDDDAGQIVISDNNGNKITLDSGGIQIERGGKKVLVSSSEVNVNDGALEVL